MQTALITGPTGIIGIALTYLLISKGIRVYAVVSPHSKRRHLIPDHSLVTVLECDLHDLELLNIQTLPHIDIFYHLGWEGTSREYRKNVSLQTTNISYTIGAVRLAERLHCSAFVGAGSQAEYGRVEGTICPDTPCFPENAYGVAKLCAGEMSRLLCNDLHIRHCWGRIISAYGPNDGLNTMIRSTIRNLLSGKDCPFTLCEQQWDYIYCKDVANAFYLIGLTGKADAVYCIGSGNTYPLRHYVELMKQYTYSSSKLLFGAIPYASQQVMHLVTDITNLHRDTGFTPEYTFEQGIRESIEYERQLLANPGSAEI